MAKRENIIPYEPVGKIMEEAGAERVSQEAKVAMAEHITEYALKLGKMAVKLSSHAGRTTVTDKDIKLAERQFQ